MQGNILVTQHVVRLVLLQTRDSLYQQLATITQMPVNGVGGLAGEQTNEAAETIATELLDGLHSIPIECVGGPVTLQDTHGLMSIRWLPTVPRWYKRVSDTDRLGSDYSPIRCDPIDGVIGNTIAISGPSVSALVV